MPQKWVFGMVAIGQNRHKPVFYVVQQRSSHTLLPIISHHVSRNATILSDQWAAYRGLMNNGYLHLTVNHSQNFVDPRTGE